MEITGEQIRDLAVLARIELSDSEVAGLADDLSGIVDNFAKVSQAVDETIAPSYNPIDLPKHYRSDKPGETLTPKQALSGAPDTEDGMFKVPAILGDA